MITINAVGHGYGPLSTLTISPGGSPAVTLLNGSADSLTYSESGPNRSDQSTHSQARA